MSVTDLCSGEAKGGGTLKIEELSSGSFTAETSKKLNAFHYFHVSRVSCDPVAIRIEWLSLLMSTPSGRGPPVDQRQ